MRLKDSLPDPVSSLTWRRQLLGRIEWVLTTLAVVGFAIVVSLIGWPHGPETQIWLLWITRGLGGAYGALFLVHWWLTDRTDELPWLRRWAAPILALGILLFAVGEGWLGQHLAASLHADSMRLALVAMVAVQQMAVLAIRLATWLPLLEHRIVRKLNPGSILGGTFVLLIALGTLLLKLPNATTGSISWLDALFTSTSAVCVTGLIVVDTATAFTALGQGIILMLIQLGAFGIVTLTFFLAILTGQGFSVSNRLFLRDVLNLDNLRGLGSALSFLVLFTLMAEGAGAFLLHRAWSEAGVAPAGLWWQSIFHAVSAFCNAGFSTYSAGLADPEAATNYTVQAVIMALIILGGIGFPVILEAGRLSFGCFQRRGQRPRPTVHFRLVLWATAILVTVGGLLLWIADPLTTSQGPHAAWAALFNAISARTAGFNITDLATMSSAGTAVMILLMFVGGSPGGFAGGIKTTTFALALLNLRRILLARREVEFYGRRIDELLPNRAFAVLLLSLGWIFTATTLLLFAQPGLHLIDALFEVVSGYSTVGLSRGITGSLEPASKAILIATMFIGRIGVMNFFFSLLVVSPEQSRLRLPQERIIIE